MEKECWMSVQNMTAIINMIATVTLAFLTFKYLRVCRRQSDIAKQAAESAANGAKATEETVRVQLWLEAQKLVRRDEFYEARKKIMRLERPLRVPEWSNAQATLGATENEARIVCRDMDQLAWLVKITQFPQQMQGNLWEDTFSKTWIVLKPLVEYERNNRGPGVKWNAFAELGEAAIRKLGWPSNWKRPDDELLKELGWKWEEVKQKTI